MIFSPVLLDLNQRDRALNICSSSYFTNHTGICYEHSYFEMNTKQKIKSDQ